MSCRPHSPTFDSFPLTFDPARLYRSTDPALRALGSRSTLAKWRYHDIGPVFIQYGPRILYRGWDLNFYLGHTAAQQSSDAPPPPFDPARHYSTTDSALHVLAARSTLARWRRNRIGPVYFRDGPRIRYRGCDLNDFLEQAIVPTSELWRREAEAQATATIARIMNLEPPNSD